MTLISFAQNQEDIMLWRALRHIRNGFYIDVGAADPVEYSVTKLFYEHGWHGINIEPQPTYFELLSAVRPHDINLRLAAGREAASHLFHRIDGTGLSTFDTEIAARHRADGREVVEETIEVLPLSAICRQHRPHGPIHFLKVDVEGAEGNVLAGADFHDFRPWIVLVEATLPMSQEEAYADWEPILTGQGYSFVWFDGLNRFYLADEMKDELGKHFLVQPNVFDAFESSAQLARRAELAEQELLRVREQATDALQEARVVNQQAAETLRQVQKVANTFDQTMQSANGALAEQIRLCVEAQHVAQKAQIDIAALRSSTSWRITAPMRAVRRLLFDRGGARQALHRSATIVLQMPYGRQGVQLVRSVAPGLVERLARRYHAREKSAGVSPTPQKSNQQPIGHSTVAAIIPSESVINDLSEEEMRVLRNIGRSFGYFFGVGE